MIAREGNLRDITERKKAEQALKESERRYRSLYSAIAGGIVVQNREGVITDANDIACEILGLTRNEMGGLTSASRNWRAIHEDGSPFPSETHPSMVTLRTGKAVRNAVMGVFNPDKGEYRWILINSEPMLDSENKISSAATTFIDITDRKKAEKTLRESEILEAHATEVARERQRLFDVLEGLPAMVCLLTPDRHVAFANRSFRKRFGESKGRHCYDFCFGNKEPCSFCESYTVLDTGQPHHWQVNAPDGSIIDAHDFPFTDTDGTRMILEMDIDITEQKKMEKQLKDSERMAAIGMTAGMVGHDIRNPLQAIIGDLYLAKSELSSFPDSGAKSEVQESLSEIEKNTDYINKIVQDLQDYARPVNPKPEESDIKQTAEKIFEKNLVPKNIKLSINVEEQARVIKADPYYLNRILYNLVTNSIQAMPHGGELTIEAYKDESDTVIAVKDTGTGIPEEVKPKLFGVMFTTKARGQGFGLPVVKRMTEALGGTVAFESEAGKGTIFSVRLPSKQ